MTRQLCISITFLDSLFHGKADGDEPEWPPSATPSLSGPPGRGHALVVIVTGPMPRPKPSGG